jgi:hypothetical protein
MAADEVMATKVSCRQETIGAEFNTAPASSDKAMTVCYCLDGGLRFLKPHGGYQNWREHRIWKGKIMRNIIKISLVAALFVGGNFMAVNSLAQSRLADGLVAWYPFDGDANDVSGFNNNGVVVGATLTTDRFGNPNSAYHFAGDGSTYIVIPDSPSLDITGTMTLTAWVQTGGGGTFAPRIVSKYNYELGLDNAGPSPHVFGDTQPGGVVYSPSILLDPSRWIFLACTYDGQTLQVYTNGLPAAQLAVSGPMGVSSHALGIGENLDDFSDFFNGSIDDVRVYNRALPAKELRQLFDVESAHDLFNPGRGRPVTKVADPQNPIPPAAAVQVKAAAVVTSEPAQQVVAEPVQGLSIIKAVALQHDNLQSGSNYQLQVSSDLIHWTNQGAVFTADSSFWQSTNYWQVANWDKLFFRLIPQ